MFNKQYFETAKWIIAGIFSIVMTVVLFSFLSGLSHVSQTKVTGRKEKVMVSLSEKKRDPEPAPLPDSKTVVEPRTLEILSDRTPEYQRTQQFELLSGEDFPSAADSIVLADISMSPLIKGDFKLPEAFAAGDLDSPLTALVRRQPVYPYSAKKQRIQGFVTVRFIVTIDGTVDRVSVVEAEPPGVFDRCVIKCVSAWRFKPGTVEGVTVDSWAETTIEFELKRS